MAGLEVEKSANSRGELISNLLLFPSDREEIITFSNSQEYENESVF